jgi:dihydrofolate reductase
MTNADKPIISLVVARARDGAIGRGGKPVVMGRKTFQSIGRPLPGRHNIVVTRNPAWRADGITVAANLAEAIAAAGLDPKLRAPEIMIIGGGEIYIQALLFADRVYVTEVAIEVPDADAHFPALDPAQWHEISREAHDAQVDTPAFAFVCFGRR